MLPTVLNGHSFHRPLKLQIQIFTRIPNVLTNFWASAPQHLNTFSLLTLCPKSINNDDGTAENEVFAFDVLLSQ